MKTKFGTKSRNFKLLVRLISEICRKKEPLGDNRPRFVFIGLTSHSQKKTYSFIFLRQILIRYNLKISFSKLVKVLVLELFYGTRTRVHFSLSVLVLVLEVFCGTRTRKLSTRLHHWMQQMRRPGSVVVSALACRTNGPRWAKSSPFGDLEDQDQIIQKM